MADVKPAEVSAILREQLSGFRSEAELQEVGTVLQVGDGIARVYGLDQVMAGELLEFEDKTVGIALNLESDNVGVVLMGAGRGILEGSSVKATGKIAQVMVGKDFLGRVVDGLGQAIDGKGDIKGEEVSRVFWQDGDTRRIAEYCQRDVFAGIQTLLKLSGLPVVEEFETQS